jgi:hypothetical protein
MPNLQTEYRKRIDTLEIQPQVFGGRQEIKMAAKQFMGIGPE